MNAERKKNSKKILEKLLAQFKLGGQPPYQHGLSIKELSDQLQYEESIIKECIVKFESNYDSIIEYAGDGQYCVVPEPAQRLLDSNIFNMTDKEIAYEAFEKFAAQFKNNHDTKCYYFKNLTSVHGYVLNNSIRGQLNTLIPLLYQRGDSNRAGDHLLMLSEIGRRRIDDFITTENLIEMDEKEKQRTRIEFHGPINGPVTTGPNSPITQKFEPTKESFWSKYKVGVLIGLTVLVITLIVTYVLKLPAGK